MFGGGWDSKLSMCLQIFVRIFRTTIHITEVLIQTCAGSKYLMDDDMMWFQQDPSLFHVPEQEETKHAVLFSITILNDISTAQQSCVKVDRKSLVMLNNERTLIGAGSWVGKL